MPAPTAANLLQRMLDEVFNEPDVGRRAAAITSLFTDAVVFVDDERAVTGTEALASTVTGLLAQGPGLVFTPVGPFRGVGDLGMRAWTLAPTDGEPVLRGLDVVQVVDGKIDRLWTSLDA